MTNNYVTCPTCGRQTTARKARSHQQACKRKSAYCAHAAAVFVDWMGVVRCVGCMSAVIRPNTGVEPTQCQKP